MPRPAKFVTSNTPVQALTLLNDEVLQEAASALAAQMSKRANTTQLPADGIALGYQQMLQRPIPPATLKSLSSLYTSLPESDTAWVNIALVLLNLDETLVR
jgi:Protein of unknown function (DUF1553)